MANKRKFRQLTAFDKIQLTKAAGLNEEQSKNKKENNK